MELDEMSIAEVQQQLDHERRIEAWKSWGAVGLAMLVAAALCLVLAATVGLSTTMLLPVLGLVALVGYGVVGVARGT